MEFKKSANAEIKRAVIVRKAHEKPTPIAEILDANTFLKRLHESGEISVHEYTRRALVAAYARERRIGGATSEGRSKLSQQEGRRLGRPKWESPDKGHPIPSMQQVRKLDGRTMAPADEEIP